MCRSDALTGRHPAHWITPHERHENLLISTSHACELHVVPDRGRFVSAAVTGGE